MTTSHSAAPPTWFRIVAALAAVWMLFGVAMWFMDLLMSEATLAGMSPAEQQLYQARPTWVFVLWGIAVGSGLAGAVGLLMRKQWAVTAFVVSLISAIIQFGYFFLAMDAIAVIGAAAAAPFPMVILLIGVGLLWLANTASRRGWLDGSAAGTPTAEVAR